jgi:hypothetical protein
LSVTETLQVGLGHIVVTLLLHRGTLSLWNAPLRESHHIHTSPPNERGMASHSNVVRGTGLVALLENRMEFSHDLHLYCDCG